LKDEPYLERKKKTTAYLLQKGYELEIINKAISYLSEN
ncbi:MAG: RecX family transcriptional regulator, partial [Flavisolibacter sp.]|nr:RecX family transcriptional regulator [Flavisolibacter sp.]